MKLAINTLRYQSRKVFDEVLRRRLRELAGTHVRYGYRRLTVLLRREGWHVNAKRIYRLHREPPIGTESASCSKRAFRSSIARPTDTSVYASSETPRCRLQDSRTGWIRCSPFPVGLFHPLQHAGLSRRSPSCP